MPSETGLVAACDDPRLLGFPLWPRQREILRAVEQDGRLHVLALGRRSGKTSMAAVAAVWDACLRPAVSRHVRPGERRYAVCVATNLAQARLFVDAARSIVERSPLLSKLVVDSTDDAIAFSTGATVAAFPCTARGARGWPISLLVLDEYAHHVDGDGNSAAESVWRALTPSVAQFGSDGRIIVASTPYGAEGAFADLFHRAAGGEIDGAVAHHFTSAEMNPTLDPYLLRAEYERDPETFASEYEARFVGSGGAFIDADRLAACVSERSELHPLDGTGWIAGLDPGFASDPFGLVIVGRDSPNTGRLRLAVARSWRPTRGMSFEQRRRVEDATLDEVAEVCRAYDVTRAVTDQHLAPAIIGHLAERGVRVKTLPMTATTKDLAYQELRQRINQGTLELYPHPDLLAELRRLRTRYAAGRSSVVNPRVGGSHGDLAQALALATWAARRSPDVHAHYGYEPEPPAWVAGDYGPPLARDPYRGFM